MAFTYVAVKYTILSFQRHFLQHRITKVEITLDGIPVKIPKYILDDIILKTVYAYRHKNRIGKKQKNYVSHYFIYRHDKKLIGNVTERLPLNGISIFVNNMHQYYYVRLISKIISANLVIQLRCGLSIKDDTSLHRFTKNKCFEPRVLKIITNFL